MISNYTTSQEYPVNIDFDAASSAWTLNKKKIGNGCYKYVCIAITKKGLPCCNKPLKHKQFCYCHVNKDT
jgi:hypothetical protein